jgi:hypothetical protein
VLQCDQGGTAAVQLLMGNNHRSLCGSLLSRVCCCMTSLQVDNTAVVASHNQVRRRCYSKHCAVSAHHTAVFSSHGLTYACRLTGRRAAHTVPNRKQAVWPGILSPSGFQTVPANEAARCTTHCMIHSIGSQSAIYLSHLLPHSPPSHAQSPHMAQRLQTVSTRSQHSFPYGHHTPSKNKQKEAMSASTQSSDMPPHAAQLTLVANTITASTCYMGCL